MQTDGQQSAFWLAALLGLFCLRVAAQLVQAAFDLPFLPPFEAWHSGVLPYSLLLGCQLALIAGMLWLLRRIRRDELGMRKGWALAWLAGGGLYFSLMAFRLIAGLTFLSDAAWFAAWLPSLFHLVLASFILVAGRYFLRRSDGR